MRRRPSCFTFVDTRAASRKSTNAACRRASKRTDRYLRESPIRVRKCATPMERKVGLWMGQSASGGYGPGPTFVGKRCTMTPSDTSSRTSRYTKLWRPIAIETTYATFNRESTFRFMLDNPAQTPLRLVRETAKYEREHPQRQLLAAHPWSQLPRLRQQLLPQSLRWA